jgi:predicted SAM-dependent methyltransferase
MILLDLGGLVNRRDLGGKWTIIDIREGADIIMNFNDLDKTSLPYKNNSVDAIFTCHTLEHIEPNKQRKFFSEMYRVLKKGAPIRIILPDCEQAIKWYYENDWKLTRRLTRKDDVGPDKGKSVPATKMGFLTAWFYTPGYGHRIGFDYETLCVYLKDANFKDIKRLKHGKHSKIFEGKDQKKNSIDGSMHVEARK